jgi:hypothetical protein
LAGSRASLRNDRATRPRREWLERVYVDLRSYQRRERGGHFMAIENPDGFVDELRSFFEQLTTER